MKKVKAVRYDELEGKTVAGAGFGWSEMLIAFTDGTVLALSAESTYDGSEIDFEQTEIDITTKKWAHVADEAELLTDAEMKAIRQSEDAKRAKRLRDELKELESRQNP